MQLKNFTDRECWKKSNGYPEVFFDLSLCILFFFILVHVGSATAAPVVISTNPVNGATGVRQTADVVSITFNKPMNTAYRSVSTSNWSSSYFTNYWSEDGKTLYLPRQDAHFDVHAMMISAGKRQLLDGVVEISDKNHKPLQQMEDQVDELYRQICQLKVETDFLARKLDS